MGKQVRLGSGYTFPFTILNPGTDPRENEEVTDVVDVALLPKAIGGDAVSVDEDGEEDETCVRGFHHQRLSELLKGLEQLK